MIVMENPRLLFSPSPHIHTARTVRSTMTHVLIALVPAFLCSLWYFGLPAMTLTAVCIMACMATEWAVDRWLLGRPSSLGDLTAVVTGLLLAMNLPSSLPWWTAVLGSVFAVGVAKMAFGGLGCNIFNPAITGRVFLLISFPALMTRWPLPGAGFAPDAATGATLLGRLKLGEAIDPALTTADMLLGNMGGSLGETGALAIIIGLVYLLAVRVISWHIPVAIVATVAVFDLLVGTPAVVDILSGGLLLGAVFMATDYVTSPMTRPGMLVYGCLIGLVTVIIRRWGAYPEGMSFAILLGNAVTPLINRYMRPARFGANVRKEVSA